MRSRFPQAGAFEPLAREPGLLWRPRQVPGTCWQTFRSSAETGWIWNLGRRDQRQVGTLRSELQEGSRRPSCHTVTRDHCADGQPRRQGRTTRNWKCLGREESSLRCPDPASGALPLGHSPLSEHDNRRVRAAIRESGYPSQMWSGDHWLGHLTRSTPSALRDCVRFAAPARG